MRVLVVLGRDPGQVVSRADLISLCWDGVIVGDNATKRVIFRLRRVLEDLSDGAVRLETITKVGFRLICETDGAAKPLAPAPAPPSTAPEANGPVPRIVKGRLTRRAVAASALALGTVSTLGYALWNEPKRRAPRLLARELYERGMLMRRSASPMNAAIATSLFKRAVALDPNLADAWGALAISLTSGKMGYGSGVRDSLSLIRSTAQRALQLDPLQGEAQIALIETEADLGRWYDQEARLRSIARSHPELPLAHGRLGMLLSSVGRNKEAIVQFARMFEVEESLPFGYVLLAEAQHCAGQDYDADATFEQGFERFPGHFLLWLARFNVLLGGKRYAQAVEFLGDSRFRPTPSPEKILELRLGVAEALATNSGIERQLSIVRESIAANIATARGALVMLAELGEPSLVLDVIEAYHLGGEFAGRDFPAPDPLAKRSTADLFLPGILAAKVDARYASMLVRLGLENYWRESGSQPDFRLA